MALSPVKSELTEKFIIPEEHFSRVKGVTSLSVEYICLKDIKNQFEEVDVDFGWQSKGEIYCRGRFEFRKYRSSDDIGEVLGTCGWEKRYEITSLLRDILPDYVARILPKHVQPQSPSLMPQ